MHCFRALARRRAQQLLHTVHVGIVDPRLLGISAVQGICLFALHVPHHQINRKPRQQPKIAPPDRWVEPNLVPSRYLLAVSDPAETDSGRNRQRKLSQSGAL